jgi:VCBS repeat protein
VKRTALLLLLATSACSSQNRPAAPPPAPAAAMTPTPGVLTRIDPSVVEETDTYVIRRLPKDQYIRVDERHIKSPIAAPLIEFFKEDGQYYYVSYPKAIPGEAELKALLTPTPGLPAASARSSGKPVSPGVTAADFADLSPERVSGRLHLEKVASTGLPEKGLWRSSFVAADVNRDRIPDLVATTARLGDGKLHIWIGDGKGRFSPWNISYSEKGKPLERFSIDYGGVAVEDIDGDSHMDVVAASHGFGLVSLFGDGQGSFEVVRAGLPKRDFSSQAVVLLDANGDGKPDIVASRDSSESTEGAGGVDKTQVRVYLFLGRQQGWEFKKDGLIGGFYSNALHAWDFDRDGKKDVLTGSHYTGALTLLWKNAGDGTFPPVQFDAIEGYSYHFSTAPGTYGKDRAAAYADAYSMQANVPETMRASGVSLYVFRNGSWTRHRVWRKAEFKAYLFGLAMGDLDGDGLDDLVIPDSESRKLKVLFQRLEGGFVEAAEPEEPSFDSPGQCVRLVDLDGDGRLDVVLSKTVSSSDPRDQGGWDVYLNRR